MTALSSTAGAQAPAEKTIALTFDDLPVSTIGQDPSAAAQARAKEITTKILAALKKHNAPATGFVNEEKLNTPGARDARASLLQDWLNAGMKLGNHGYSHLEFSSVSLAAYEDDFVRGDVITPLLVKMHGGAAPRFFRYPFNDTGDTVEKKQAFIEFMKARSFAAAPMTFENDDWMYTALYEPASAKGNAERMGRLKAAYLEGERARERKHGVAFAGIIRPPDCADCGPACKRNECGCTGRSADDVGEEGLQICEPGDGAW